MNRHAKYWLVGAVASAVLLALYIVFGVVAGSANSKQFDAVRVLRTEAEVRSAMENPPQLYILEGVPLGGSTVADKLGALPEGGYLYIRYQHQKVEYDASDDGGYEWESQGSEKLETDRLCLWEDIPLQGKWQWDDLRETKYYPTGDTRKTLRNERYEISYVPAGAKAVLCVRAGNGSVEIAKPCDEGDPVVQVDGTLKRFRERQMSDIKGVAMMCGGFSAIALIVCVFMYIRKRGEQDKQTGRALM